MRIAAPPTEPPPSHSSIIQVLFPLVGGVGHGRLRASSTGTRRSCTSAGAMMVLLLLAFRSACAVAEARRAQAGGRGGAPLRQVPARARPRAGRGGRSAARRTRAPVPRRREALDAGRQAPRGLGAPPGPRDFLHVRLGKGAIALDRPVELDLGMNPLAEYQKHPLHEARRLVERRARAAQRAGRRRPRRGRRARRHRRPGAFARMGARADDPARGLARAARPAPGHRASTPSRPTPGSGGSGCRTSGRSGRARRRRPARSPARGRARGDARAADPPADRTQLRRIADADQHTQRSFELTAPELVVIVDGWTPGHRSTKAPPSAS